jgi:NADH-quinone oxidoreductase subunit M
MLPSSLPSLLLLPFIGAILIAILPKQRLQLIRNTAISIASLTLLLSLYLLGWGDITPTETGLWQSYTHDWHTRLGTSFSLGVDGLSYPMVILTTLLIWISVLASTGIKQHSKGYYLLIFVLETAILGVFMAQDWALFYIFWEFTLIPLFFLIDRWGGKRRQAASLNFVLYTMGGSVFMLLSLLLLFDASSTHSFAFEAIAEGVKNLDGSEQTLIFIGLLIGFGVKMPIFPLHGWLPLAHVEAPSPISILLSGILLKMGAYGLIRATVMLPEAAIIMQSTLMVIALITISYGGLLAWRQSDMKKMIAYSSISHMGIVLLGISSLNINGFTGAIYQMVAHGLVAGALFMLIGLLYERTHTRNINDYGSLLKSTPMFAFFIVIAFVAGVGLPGTVGFIAELHVLIGGFERWGWAMMFLSFAVLVTAAYGVRTIKLLFTGPVKSHMKEVADLQPSEIFAASILLLLIIVFGFYPNLILTLISPSVAEFIQHIDHIAKG